MMLYDGPARLCPAREMEALMNLRSRMAACAVLAATLITLPASPRPPQEDSRILALKENAAREVESLRDLTQEMIDTIFSFGELGFQEFETSKYCVAVLRKYGFSVQEGVAGIPTAWVATWGSGKPVISLGSDIDGLPQTSQRPGVAYRDPLIEGAPGHGEGHNSGVPLNITAAVAVKKIMEREQIPGTFKSGRGWPKSHRGESPPGPGGAI